MPKKKYVSKNDKKIMFNGSNRDRKAQLSGVLTEPLNQRNMFKVRKQKQSEIHRNII